MDDFDDKDESKRKSRNASEKKRRDQFNILLTELGNMVSPGGSINKKMDKTTVLRSTISFLRQQKESSVKSAVHEIGETWKPSFLTNEEFTHLMLEALAGFILVFGIDGGIIYASESVTSVIGQIPQDLENSSIYEYIKESDKPSLYTSLGSPKIDDNERTFMLHMKKGGLDNFNSLKEEQNNDDDDTSNKIDDRYILVQMKGFFRKWNVSQNGNNENSNSDDENGSVKSGFSMFSSSTRETLGGKSEERSQGHAGVTGLNLSNIMERTVFVCIATLQNTQLLREMPLLKTSEKNEFTSRYSLEWKFLFLDQRAPQIIGYLPFELLGTSGYEYYHMDDLDRIAQCHEALMQTGEGTSCYHRFLSKGQQWIWLQARYYITYHQWNSKPEFIVATHRVVNYNEIIGHIKRDESEENIDVKDNASEVGSTEVKSSHYPTTDSPTWSSRSSVCGGGNSSTGTGTSSKVGEKSHVKFGNYHSDGQSDECCELDTISQYTMPKEKKHRKSTHINHQRHHQHQNQVNLQPQLQQQHQQSLQSIPVQPDAIPIAIPPICIPGATPAGAPRIFLNPSAIKVAPPEQPPKDKSSLYLKAAKSQLYEQLRAKHDELQRRIEEQQAELRRISELLMMSQYGLVPVNVSEPPEVVSSSSVSSTLGDQSIMIAPLNTTVGQLSLNLPRTSSVVVVANHELPTNGAFIQPGSSVSASDPLNTPFVSQGGGQIMLSQSPGNLLSSTTSTSGGGLTNLGNDMVYTSITSDFGRFDSVLDSNEM